MNKIITKYLHLFSGNYFRSVFYFFIIITITLNSSSSFSQITTRDWVTETDKSVIKNQSTYHRITVIACDNPTTFNCSNNRTVSAMIMDTQANKEFFFDSFSKYKGGITLNGSTILKLKVAAASPSLAALCQWKLVMIVSNGSSTATPTPASEWETLTTYGAGSTVAKPSIDYLQVRVSNGCNTPKLSGVWQQFQPADGDVIEIINPNSIIVAPGAGTGCSGGETNGAGTYLGADYNEFSFTVDYRILPNVGLTPGRYELFIKFCLVEK